MDPIIPARLDEGLLGRGSKGSTLVEEPGGAGLLMTELRHAEVRYRALVEQIPAITYTQVEDPRSPTGFRDVYISPQTLPILGYTPEEWQADPTLWVQATHPDDRDMVIAQDHWSATTGDRFHSEYRMISRDGRTVWFRDEAALIEDPSTGVHFWQGVMLDITEMKASAEDHATTQAKYQNLVEQLPCVVYLAQYGDEGDWLYISPQLERVLGFTPKEWMAHPHPQASFTHPDDIDRVRTAEQESLATRNPFRIEYRMQRRDGAWLWLLDEATVVLDEDGRPLCLQGLLYDITERKQAEERLVALDRLKNTLLHTLSHDLKEPLTAIQGSASTLERLDETLEPEERKLLLRTLVERTKGMNALLTDLLDLERLESGFTEPRRFPVDLVELAHRVIDGTDVLGGRAVQVAEGRCLASVDAPKVARIVDNLLSNAARHTPPGTPIRVRCWREGEAAVLAVEDEGPGVPQGYEEIVFEAFHRGPNAEGMPGSGIGLSLVARFAELHGGRAWVEPREGGGASFRVRLPDGETV
jgi:PAS domain S-box-containing protein